MKNVIKYCVAPLPLLPSPPPHLPPIPHIPTSPPAGGIRGLGRQQVQNAVYTDVTQGIQGVWAVTSGLCRTYHV